MGCPMTAFELPGTSHDSFLAVGLSHDVFLAGGMSHDSFLANGMSHDSFLADWDIPWHLSGRWDVPWPLSSRWDAPWQLSSRLGHPMTAFLQIGDTTLWTWHEARRAWKGFTAYLGCTVIPELLLCLFWRPWWTNCVWDLHLISNWSFCWHENIYVELCDSRVYSCGLGQQNV